jgi:hypothetical protein|tara:strand:- start:168 stop:392 length:225 start_codon:yes stop_codon:yes gene_type:complete
MKKHVNGEDIEMTAEEVSEREADITQLQVKDIARKEAKVEQDAAQASGNTKLLDLGLTQAEATALTGYVPPAEV